MPRYLRRKSEKLSLTEWDWNYALRLAETYDFNAPMGPSKIGPIPREDAAALVAALERALPNIPDEVTAADDRGISSLPDNPLDWFSGEGKDTVQQIIAFCKGGQFLIE